MYWGTLHPTELRSTLLTYVASSEQRCTLLSYDAPIELSYTLLSYAASSEQRCTLLSYDAPTEQSYTLLSYAALCWATLHPSELCWHPLSYCTHPTEPSCTLLSCDAPYWAMLYFPELLSTFWATQYPAKLWYTLWAPMQPKLSYLSMFLYYYNTVMPDCPASSQSSTGMKTNVDAGTSSVPE